MINLEQVKLEEVAPSGSNPRKDFGDIESLAKSFAANTERPGEPVNPPLLVRDGKCYRIVDGERRYRAMKEIGTKTFTANVCDNLDEANCILDMLATDDKMHLNDYEKSQGVQQALLLGVDPRAVALTVKREASEIERAGAGAKILAALKKKGSPESHSIDRLIAIARLDELGLTDAIEKVEQAPDGEWEFIAYKAEVQIGLDSAEAELRAIIEDEGVEIPDKNNEPTWETHARLEYINNKDDLRESIQRHKGTGHTDLVAMIHKGSCHQAYHTEPGQAPGYVNNPTVTLWCNRGDLSSKEAELSPEEIRAERLHDQFNDADKRRDKFVAERIENLQTSLPNITELVMQSLHWQFKNPIDDFNDEYGTSIAWEPSPALLIYVFSSWHSPVNISLNILDLITKEYKEVDALRYVKLLEVFKADGYEPDESEMEIYQLCVESIDHFAAQDDLEEID